MAADVRYRLWPDVLEMNDRMCRASVRSIIGARLRTFAGIEKVKEA